MDLSNIARNDLCPCGSGKKFKKCHMGRENELLDDTLSVDPAQLAMKIIALPACAHPRAAEMAASLEIVSPAGKQLKVKLVDLAAYCALTPYAKQNGAEQNDGGVVINPLKTKLLDPGFVYLALSPKAGDSTIVHELAHVIDMVCGSCLPAGKAQEMAGEMSVPVELLEHPQEFGDKLIELAERFAVSLDAEDEIIAILARRQLLLPARMVAKGDHKEIVAAAEKTMRFMQNNQAEIDARIREREGYLGPR
ncbi:SEC-C motif domain protein [Desulfarculus baarsii DSM 2075]|uniref:SEC-C motif domain protein n=1 Tax=Desulfarculus baarsii (strain ATCC 33931 / DSM 2075 / LMG 7858 / VKM B-1802 / 2st14) TaxID=644282 RepID=E1QFM2_DESB2|nr:SEC-C domain-containing protein [Desulfarculus baarsii]ADK84358.1 SEC-C motif domain protein [Desulfarculus baarsii DSM 2075]